MPPEKIILGSSSEHRKIVLRDAGYDFDVIAADIDERAIHNDDPEQLAIDIANAKADAILPKITEPALLVTGDQVVVWNGEVRGKPKDSEQAKHFLKTSVDYPPETISALVVVNTATGKRASGADRVRTSFNPIPEDVINRVVAKGITMTTAGGFQVRDEDLKPYIEHMTGTQDSIEGFPLALLEKLMEEVAE